MPTSSLSPPPSTSNPPPTPLKEATSRNIHTLSRHGELLVKFTHHIPHLSDWEANAGTPRPTLWSDLKYIYRRQRYLHRRPLQELVRTLQAYGKFECVAREVQFRDTTYDVRRLERLTWTYAHAVREVCEGLRGAQGSGKWRREEMSEEFCAALNRIVKVQVEWLRDLECSGGRVYQMKEVSHLHQLAAELETAVVWKDARLRRIAAAWRDECCFGPQETSALWQAPSELIARHFA